jgi:hypothetical protein
MLDSNTNATRYIHDMISYALSVAMMMDLLKKTRLTHIDSQSYSAAMEGSYSNHAISLDHAGISCFGTS